MAHSTTYDDFINTVWEYYAQHARDLPWREIGSDGNIDPYHVLVSEIMLQQTQVARVTPKYQEFLRMFPTVNDLAAAPLSDVLKLWSGLGYNRRAKFLREAAQKIMIDFDGNVPATRSELVTLPGVGVNTAGAIVVYGFNKPESFVETNIRSVYIHHFFANQDMVNDKELLPIITKTVDNENPREWYWALMDYGSFLKATQGNAGRRSTHYAKQSRFEGSTRQVRGAVLRQLAVGSQTELALLNTINDERLRDVLIDLEHEGLITKINTLWKLAS